MMCANMCVTDITKACFIYINKNDMLLVYIQ